MSDLERFIELYKSVGIELTPTTEDDKKILHLEAEHHKSFVGYGMFFSDIDFDLDGKFIEQGFWE